MVVPAYRDGEVPRSPSARCQDRLAWSTLAHEFTQHLYDGHDALSVRLSNNGRERDITPTLGGVNHSRARQNERAGGKNDSRMAADAAYDDTVAVKESVG